MLRFERKIFSLRSALAWRARMKKAGRRVVFTNGCFDLLHKGHVTLLQAARNAGDALLVGLNSDKSVRSIKGPGRPVNCEMDRASVLAALESVDGVALFSEDTPYELLKRLRPDVLVKGADYKASEIVGGEFAGKVLRVRLVEGRSTTGMIKKLKKV